MAARRAFGRLLNALLRLTPPRVLLFLGGLEYRHELFRRLARGFLRSAQETEATISAGPGAGLRFTSAGGFPGRTLGIIEPELQDALAALLEAGGTFYDLGANIGFFTLIGARLVGPSGHVVAVEPQPAAAEGLRRNVAANGFENVTVVEAAVADVVGTSDFHVSTENILEWGALGSGDGTAPVLRVPVTTVDTLVSGGLPAPTVVKLDVEGAEARALRGMTKTIESRRPAILCEIHGTLDETRALVESAGYRVELTGGNGASGGGYYGQLLAR